MEKDFVELWGILMIGFTVGLCAHDSVLSDPKIYLNLCSVSMMILSYFVAKYEYRIRKRKAEK